MTVERRITPLYFLYHCRNKHWNCIKLCHKHRLRPRKPTNGPGCSAIDHWW